MTVKTHVLAGVLISQPFILTLPESAFGNKSEEILFKTVFLFCAGFLAALPDLDHQGSALQRRGWLLFWWIPKITKHRGALHTPIALVSLFLVGYVAAPTFVSRMVFEMCIVAILSHLILDSLNPRGIMGLYPMKKEYYRTSVTIVTGN